VTHDATLRRRAAAGSATAVTADVDFPR